MTSPKWTAEGGTKLLDPVKSAVRKCWDENSAGVKTILYAIFITLAWSLAIWDVSGVVQDYRENNIVTQVKREAIINQDGAFVENVEACVTYQVSIFEKIWWNESSEVDVGKLVKKAYDSPDQKNLTRTVLQGLFAAWKEDEHHVLTKEQTIHVLKLLRIVRNLDICRYTHKLENYSCSERNYEVFWDDNDFARMKNESIKFLKKVSPDNNWTTVSTFDRYKICHIIDVRQAITADPDRTAPYGLVTGEDENSKNQSGPPQFVSLEFPMYTIDKEMVGAAQSFHANIIITTRGLSDRTQVNPNCFSPESLPEITLENCTDWVFVEAVKRYCGCYPYLFQATKFQNTDPPLPYCTSQNYSNCVDNVRINVSQTECENCLNALNNYFYDVDLSLSPTIEGKRHSFEMTFLVQDQYFYRYQDNFKATKQNVIAQVGGDIGFYTGFSMWALWKFIMFITSAFRQFRRSIINEDQDQENSTTNTRPSNIRSIFLAMHRSVLASLGYMREGDSDVKKQVLDEEKENFMTARIKIMEEATMIFVSRVEQMKNKEPGNSTSNLDMDDQTDDQKDAILNMDDQKDAILNMDGQKDAISEMDDQKDEILDMDYQKDALDMDNQKEYNPTTKIVIE